MIQKESLIKFKSTINCRGEIIDLSKPKVMGILNLTPDSFYDGGRNNIKEKALQQVERMLDEGADFIDVGAHSTRPDSSMLTAKEEMNRLKPVLSEIKKKFPSALLSIDTFNADVAEFTIQEFSVDIINDVSAGELDVRMWEILARYNLPYIIMHMRGKPANMQKKTDYNDVIVDIITYFASKIEKAKELGINDIIIDPGFGFSKNLEQNYTLLKGLNEFKIIGLPILVGLSRKSMIYKLLECDPENALNGTIALNAIAILNGANILRVHDVKEAKEVINLMNMIIN